MKDLVFKLYRNIFKIFSKRIGSDKFTSEAAALSLTSLIISSIVFAIIVLGLRVLTTQNYFFVVNKVFIFLIFFAIYLIVEFRIKKAVEKNL